MSPITYPSPFVAPGKHHVYTGVENVAWGQPPVNAVSEWVDDFVYAKLADIMDLRERGGVVSGIIDREQLTHHGDLTLTMPFRQYGAAMTALCTMFGSQASGASDSFSGSGPYKHALKLGTSSNRLNTMSIWDDTGAGGSNQPGNVELYKGCTIKSYKLTWEAKVLLSAEALFESLHPVTTDDGTNPNGLYYPIPTGSALTYIGTAGVVNQVSRTRTRGLDTSYQVIGSNGQAYNTIFTGGDLTIVRALDSVYGKSGASIASIPTLAPAATPTATPSATGGLLGIGTYLYKYAYLGALGPGPLSAAISATTTTAAASVGFTGFPSSGTDTANGGSLGVALYRTKLGVGFTETITIANAYMPGDSVTISGATPAGYNGTWTVVSSSPTAFTISTPTNLGAITAGTALPASVVVTVANSFVAGQQILISGATPAGYNGTWTVAWSDGTHFAFSTPTNLGAPTAGTATAVTGAAGTASTASGTATSPSLTTGSAPVAATSSTYYYVATIPLGTTIYTDVAADTALSAVQTYPYAPTTVDPFGPTDLQPGDLEMTGSFSVLFDGSASGSSYRDFLDFQRLGASGAALTHKLLWRDREGSSLELDFYPITFDAVAIDRSGQGVRATISWTAYNDPAAVGGPNPSLSILSAVITNNTPGALIL